jgi:hypothetical protein
MKLAEALILRANLQTRLEKLKGRLLQNALVQEGEKPAEDPLKLLQELEQVADELATLVQQINRTNLETRVNEEQTLTDALAVRDVLRLKQGVYWNLGQAASVRQHRYSRSEIKLQSSVNVPRILQRADELAREYRELDTLIQAANWANELQ